MAKRYFRDFYGYTAAIVNHRDGTASYIVRNRYGHKVGGEKRKTPRSARIALGRWSDCWQEVNVCKSLILRQNTKTGILSE